MMTKVLQLDGIVKKFGSVTALNGVTFDLVPGEIHCLLGDNGAGKSTLIRIISGYHRPSEGSILFEGSPVEFGSPSDALNLGIATVYQDLALVPLMSVTRNFFMGREPVRSFGPIKHFRRKYAARIAAEQMRKIGISVADPNVNVGVMSGGERQTLAIARAVYFGAKVLILDEPTSALGVRQTAAVLKYMLELRQQGVAIIFITHNARQAYAVGNRFTVLNRGRSLGTFTQEEKTRDELEDLMSGTKELIDLVGSVRTMRTGVSA
ncbi:MAG: ATP-binding cassette domain-containing protein [Rhizobiaceae bacterium]|jgi:simple sugar transport system ATP-binding protein